LGDSGERNIEQLLLGHFVGKNPPTPITTNNNQQPSSTHNHPRSHIATLGALFGRRHHGFEGHSEKSNPTNALLYSWVLHKQTRKKCGGCRRACSSLVSHFDVRSIASLKHKQPNHLDLKMIVTLASLTKLLISSRSELGTKWWYEYVSVAA
jgi:hypothetical protein